MNHVIEINNNRYIIRHQNQKIILLNFPQLHLIHKYYINASFSYVNQYTREVLVINQNQINILQPVITPLQLVSVQQSFIDWQPSGGILMQNTIVLYGVHGIVFYTRSNIMEKTWQIQVLQEIEEIKSNKCDQTIAMKVKEPKNTLFLWRLSEPTVKPSQQIILTRPILQWNFVRQDLLAILTSTQLRIYIQGSQNFFNLYHFHLITANSFCWINHQWTPKPNRTSVNSVILMGKKGSATVVQLFGLQKRVLQSQMKEIGKMQLKYKSVNMKRVIEAWGFEGKIGLICQTKNRQLFSFDLDKNMLIQRVKAFEECLGAQIKQVYLSNGLVLAKDRTRWKLFKMNAIGGFELYQELDCEKAFIWSQKLIVYVYQQAIYTKYIKGERGDPLAFKYPDSSKLHRIYSDQDSCFIVAGIRFYKISINTVASAGFALKNEKAQFVSVDIQNKKLTYKINDQFVLLNYVISGNKIITSTIKSSSKQLISVKGTRWIELNQLDFSLGQENKVISVFPLSKLLKILDSQNKIYNYSLHSLHGQSIILIIKNYVFFLQIVENQKTCQIILIKRMNTVLYHRFNPQAQTIKLAQAKTLTFWVDNTVISLGNKINLHAITDPYSPPQTLMSKQLQNKKVFPPHHPRIIQLLIQTNNFSLVLQIFKKVRNWLRDPSHVYSTLYKIINVQFITNVLWKNNQQNLSRWPQQRIQEQVESVSKLASQILDNIQGIQLRQKAPFILQSILESFAYYLSNSKIIDIFSQSTLILSKTSILKEKSLSSMHVAHLLHSLNKEEAAQQLKPEKMSWQWLRDKSIPFWIQSKDSLKKWIEQIAAQQYRNKKDPFDCLFWYLLVGKKTLLATLFKNHTLDSKEHDSMAKFLLRDFNQAKDRSAAVKNAYVLIDKKRYLHALSFFILGGSMDDCIRLCIDRLKDLNLAYTFILLFKEVSNTYFLSQLSKGDVWMKHISLKLSNKHILSYNCLFESNDINQWDFIPQLTGFHPSLIEFAQKIKNSIPVKRQIEAQKQANCQSDDIFADFYDDAPAVKEQKKKDLVQLKGDIDDLKPSAIKYYIREGAPILALALEQSNVEAKEAYSLELYKLSGQVDPIMEPVLFALEDKLSIIKCLLLKKEFKQIKRYLAIQNQKFKQYLTEVQLVEVIQTKKHIVGEILHFGYFSEKIALLDFKQAQKTQCKEQYNQIIAEVGKLSKVAKILCCLILEYYQDLFDLLEDLKLQKIIPSPQIWTKLKVEYDGLIELKKLKQLKQMDHFQHAFTSIYRPNKNETVYHSQLAISSDQGALLLVRICVFNFLIKQNLSIKPVLTKIKINIQSFYRNWFTNYKQSQLQGQFKILLKQGTQAKLKLPLLNKVFDTFFTQIYDVIALTHAGYFQQLSFTQIEDKSKELQAIQVFKNRQDGVKSFIINIQQGKGLECIILFKKLFKKAEVCESLAKRERTKDGYGLLVDDSGYTNISNADLSPYLKAKHSPCINQALQNILNTTKNTNTNNKFPRSTALISQKDYVRAVEAPYLDYNELNSIQCHPFLPFFLIGGKGLIQVAHLSTLKNFNRIKCPGMSQIVKLHSCGQRVGGVDSNGNLNLYHFDPAFQNNCVFSLKKNSIIDFCYLNPSVLAVISSTQIQVFDTLINPKRQLKFKQPFTKDPLSISSIGPNRVAVLRKNEVLIYDIRNEKLESSKQLKGKGRSMIVEGNNLYVGQTDSKIRVFNINSATDTSEVIKVGLGDQKQREKYSIDQLMNYENIVLALSSEGSIYYLPKLSKPIA